jgi:Tfp pilus assembly protein PilO
MRLKPTKTTIALLGGAVALVIAAAGGVLYVQNEALGREEAKLAAKQIEQAQSKKITERRDEALQALQQDREKLQFLEASVSNAAYVPTLLKQLEDLGVNTRNHVLGVRPQVATQAPTRLQQRRDPEAQAKGDAAANGAAAPVPEEPYTPLTIQVSMVGNFTSSQQFIERLTRFPKIMGVEEMQMRPHQPEMGSDGKPKGRVDLLDIEMKVTAYVMKPDKNSESSPAGSGGQPGGAAAPASIARGGTTS